ncbi:MAG: leucine-rich repeat domain-containing protein [Bacteroidales bacterium]|nr:leucine-rich repeat domain-containing protein [Bacteroidales bacterium]
MSEKELYKRLLEAYSDKNLNKITAKLIHLYKSRQFGLIREISNNISAFISCDTEKINKCFSKLVMLYHPDRGSVYRIEIEDNFHSGNHKKQHQLSHIFLIEYLKDLQDEDIIISDDIDYSPEYGWEEDLDGYTYFTDQDLTHIEDINFNVETRPEKVSFLNAIKRKIFGNADIEIPTFYLENYEEIEIADYEISNLEGIELCRHVKRIDLSGNNIINLSGLRSLTKLEEIYLADNKIMDILHLINLKNLKILDLSNNQIKDISSLLKLNKLEYVNLSGNNIATEQLKILHKSGCIVISN